MHQGMHINTAVGNIIITVHSRDYLLFQAVLLARGRWGGRRRGRWWWWRLVVHRLSLLDHGVALLICRSLRLAVSHCSCRLVIAGGRLGQETGTIRSRVLTSGISISVVTTGARGGHIALSLVLGATTPVPVPPAETTLAPSSSAITPAVPVPPGVSAGPRIGATTIVSGPIPLASYKQKG